jgi:hypothetical protein
MRLPGVGFKSYQRCRGCEPIAIEHERQETSAPIFGPTEIVLPRRQHQS